MLDLIDIKEAPDERVEAVRVSERYEEDITRRSVTRFTRAMIVALAILLLFNSERLLTVVNALGVGPVQDTIVAMAVTWDTQMEKTGMKKLSDTIHRKIDMLRAASWDDTRALSDSEAARKSMEQGASFLRGMLEESSRDGLAYEARTARDRRG